MNFFEVEGFSLWVRVAGENNSHSRQLGSRWLNQNSGPFCEKFSPITQSVMVQQSKVCLHGRMIIKKTKINIFWNFFFTPGSFRRLSNLNFFKNVDFSLCGKPCVVPRKRIFSLYFSSLCKVGNFSGQPNTWVDSTPLKCF